MQTLPFSAVGWSFSLHEWRGSGPAVLHVHHSDDEACTCLKANCISATPTERRWRAPERPFLFLRAQHTYEAKPGTRYLIVLTPRLSALIAALQSDRDPAHQKKIYQRFNSELLE